MFVNKALWQKCYLSLLFLQVIEKQHRMMEQLGSQIQVIFFFFYTLSFHSKLPIIIVWLLAVRGTTDYV